MCVVIGWQKSAANVIFGKFTVSRPASQPGHKY